MTDDRAALLEEIAGCDLSLARLNNAESASPHAAIRAARTRAIVLRWRARFTDELQQLEAA